MSNVGHRFLQTVAECQVISPMLWHSAELFHLSQRYLEFVSVDILMHRLKISLQTGGWKSSSCQPRDVWPSIDLIGGEAMGERLNRRQRDVERERQKGERKQRVRRGRGVEDKVWTATEEGGRESSLRGSRSALLFISPSKLGRRSETHSGVCECVSEAEWITTWGLKSVHVTAISDSRSFKDKFLFSFRCLQGIKEKVREESWWVTKSDLNISGRSHGTKLTSHTHTHT